ncbi:MAG TPA: Rnf-Nqr domain containing protein [Steroidobacter sp.]|jgi:electron transport complex protein RnfE|nr:Rnf-Nqr domain containing protein [Steroidobacter sp.]
MNKIIQSRDAALLLAMCPLLGVCDTAVNGLGMGAIVVIVALAGAALFTLVRPLLTEETQFAGAFLTLAGVVACLETLLLAYFYDLQAALGAFTPLVPANVALAGALTAERDARSGALARAAMVGAAAALMLIILGCARELVGRGSLLHDAGLMFGLWARPLEIKVFRVDMGFLLGMLPPGAFISLGLLLALRNWAARRRSDDPT